MRKVLSIGALIAIGLAGCTGNTLPPETDPAQGREALKRVLDAWAREASRTT